MEFWECVAIYIQQYWISVIAQLINMPLYFYLFTVKNDLKFLKLSFVSIALFGVGYWGISAWSGVIFSLFSLAYLLVSYLYKKHNIDHNVRCLTFIVVAVLIILFNLCFEREALFTNRDLSPTLCIVASIIHAYIYFCSSVNLRSSRCLFILSHTLLIAYEFIIIIPLFAMVDIFGLIANIRELKKC